MRLSFVNQAKTTWYRPFLGSILLGLLFFFCQQGTKAQSIDVEQISVTVLTESVAYPFTRYSPIHPGFEIGTTLKTNQKGNSTRSFNAYIGGFYHQRVQSSLYVRGEYQYSRSVTDALQIDFPVGVGYIHTFYPADLYEIQGDGTFETVTQTGKPRALVNLGLGITYTAWDKIQPFIKQELGIETPFASGIPLIPHSFLKLGFHLNLN